MSESIAPIAATAGVRRGRLRVGEWIALGAVALFVVLAVAPGAVAGLSPGGSDPRACSVRAPDGSFQDRLPPSSDHWLGTDVQGCDVLARVVHATRGSLSIALLGTVVAVAIALVMGGVAGYVGGPLDRVAGWIASVTLAFPVLVGAALLLSLASVHRPGTVQVALTLALLSWPIVARITRATVRGVREEPFVDAAVEAGASTARVVGQHVIPNSLPPIIAASVLLGGGLVTAEAALAYVGLGLVPPSISWGTMFEQGQEHLRDAPHLVLAPGVFIVAFVGSLVYLGDAVTRRFARRGWSP